MKKSAYKTIAESIMSGQISKADLPTARVDHRRLTVDEIKKFIKEELDKAKPEDVKPQEFPGGWGDAELEQEINWSKALKLKEFFNRDG
jgi:hypothetical protein